MSQSMKFIAETDQSGNVIWLWRLLPGNQKPRPVQDLDPIEIELKSSVIAGASLDAVLTWLTKERSKTSAVG